MKRYLTGLGLAILITSGAVAQDAPLQDDAANTALFDQGESLYRENCTECHRRSGQGTPDFPPLDDNVSLEDLSHVVVRIRRGEGAMRAFPQFEAEKIAALATYVRNAWHNDFGEISAEDVAKALKELPDMEERVATSEGVFTEAQAQRGEAIFVGRCSSCHGITGDTVGADPDQPAAPPVSGSSFLREWNGQTIYTLFAYTRLRMPTINPGSLTDEDYVDAISYMLMVSDLPAGDEELVPDRDMLSTILIEDKPG